MTVTTDIERTNGARSNRVALFIDVDNVLILSQNSGLPFYLSLIIDRVRQQGTIMSSKAYADWTSNLLRPFMGDFRASAIELVQLPTSASVKEHKNTADIQLAVDALEMAFSPVRPDTIVIVGGDRDYVPLVQKLKRYGVFVMGIGVESGVSKVLTEACDSFVYYDHILPPAPEIEEQIALPDPEEAYSLMVRAIEALNRDGRAPTGASVHAMMKQLAPTFDLARYKTTFKALANDAHREGYVALIELRGTDFTLTVGSGSGSRGISVPESAGREYDYSTMDAITASYRAILQDRRIPLLPWTLRETFVNLIWDRLDQRGDLGMSLDAMGVSLMDYSMDNGLRVSLQMVRKLLYTLNFAHCFSTLRNASLGYNVQVPEELDIPLYAVVDVSEAFDRLHKKYVELLANHGAMLHPDAVFALLYGDEIADEEEGARRRSDLEALCHSVRPMGPFGQALIGRVDRVDQSPAHRTRPPQAAPMTPEAQERYIHLAREKPDILCSEAPVDVLEDASLVGEPTEFHEAYFAAGYTSWLEHKLGRRVKVAPQQLNNAIIVLWNRACELNTSRILGRPDHRWSAHFFSDEGLYG